ncbi:hypothetical protein ACXX9E_29095 [Pseudomonas sp. GNP014]
MSTYQIPMADLAVLAGACLQGVAGYGIGTLAAPLLFLMSRLHAAADTRMPPC